MQQASPPTLESIAANQDQMMTAIESLTRAVQGNEAEGNRGVLPRLKDVEDLAQRATDDVDEIKADWKTQRRVFGAWGIAAIFVGSAVSGPLGSFLGLG